MSISVSVTGSGGSVATSIGPGAVPTGVVADAPADGGTYARQDGAWIDIEEAANLQVNRGTAAEVAAYTPLDGEPVWDSDNEQLRVGDGETQGGILVGNQTATSPGFSNETGPLSAFELISGTFSTPLAVPLRVSGSTWRITGVLRFNSFDFVDADVELDLAGSGATVILGQAWINAPAGYSYESWLAGNVQIAVAEGETAAVQIDYIVTISTATATFGIPVRRTAGTRASYLMADVGEFSRLYAQRIA